MKEYGYYLLLLLSDFLASIAQILLKKAALRKHRTFLEEYLNAPVIIGYMIMFGCTILTMLAFRGVPLSLSPAISASGYLFTTMWGRIFFGEKITKRKILGLLIIIIGILICTVEL